MSGHIPGDDDKPHGEAGAVADCLVLLSREDAARRIHDALARLLEAWGEDGARRFIACHPLDRARVVAAIVAELPQPLLTYEPIPTGRAQ